MSFQHSLGRIQAIFGPMFSGKSSQLLRRVRKFQHANKKCLIVNFQKHNHPNQDQYTATHDKQMHKTKKASKISEIMQLVQDYEVIAIDQGQFFPDVAQYSQKLANMGKIVIIAALDATFQRKPFSNIVQLLPIAEKIQKLTAICMFCYKTIPNKQIQLIGGQQCYKPACRSCYHIHKPK